MTICIVGGGIIGAAIAYYLSRANNLGRAKTPVTLLEAAPLDLTATAGPRINPHGATAGSFAWINASFHNPEPYFRLRAQSMADYHDLQRDLHGALQIDWHGCLNWDLNDRELETLVAGHRAWGYDVRILERAEIQAMVPRLREAPARAAFSGGEGALDPAAATTVLLQAARDHGAVIRDGVEVLGLTTSGGRVTGLRTAAGAVAADQVVLAAGIKTPALARQVDVTVPLKEVPGLLAATEPVAPCCRPVLESPLLHMKQMAGGEIVVGRDFGGGPLTNDPAAEAARLVADIPTVLADMPPLKLAGMTTASRPTPEDGFPIVGFAEDVPGLYIATLHSGITLAPAVGRLAAQELMGGAGDPLLAPYRPGRF